jgi:hypothetical protein
MFYIYVCMCVCVCVCVCECFAVVALPSLGGGSGILQFGITAKLELSEWHCPTQGFDGRGCYIWIIFLGFIYEDLIITACEICTNDLVISCSFHLRVSSYICLFFKLSS